MELVVTYTDTLKGYWFSKEKQEQQTERTCCVPLHDISHVKYNTVVTELLEVINLVLSEDAIDPEFLCMEKPLESATFVHSRVTFLAISFIRFYF
jgi:hypothetical protein